MEIRTNDIFICTETDFFGLKKGYKYKVHKVTDRYVFFKHARKNATTSIPLYRSDVIGAVDTRAYEDIQKELEGNIASRIFFNCKPLVLIKQESN